MAKREKAPAYQWFPKDADSDEAYKLMSYEQQGIYRALLDHQWIEGSLPLDPSQIARLLPKISVKRFLALWPGIAGCFVVEGARLVNARLEAQRTELATFISQQKVAGQRGARARWAAQEGRYSEPIESPSPPDRVPMISPLGFDSSASASASAKVLCTDERREEETLEARARTLVQESYPQWYSQYRHGAKLRLIANTLAWSDALSLVRLWDDARIEKLARVFLTTDDPWISGTDRGFRVFASRATWCDDRLKAAEQAMAV